MAETEAHSKNPLAGDVKIGNQKVPKALLVGGGGVVLVLVIVWYRNKHNSAAGSASSAATGATGSDPYPADGTYGDPTDPNSIDPQTGVTYGDEGYGSSTGGLGSGYGNGTTYSSPGQSTSTGQQVTNGPPFTSNAAWSQYVLQYFNDNSYSDIAGRTSAIGAYLAGTQVTSAQAQYINDAIAIAGDPPIAAASGFPPSINVGTPTSGGSGGGTGGGGSGGGGGGGGNGGGSGGGGSTGGSHGGPITVVPIGLHVSHLYTNSVQVVWTPPHIPPNEGPLTGYGCACYDHTGHLVNGPFKVPASQHDANFGKLKSKTRYTAHIWCDPARTGGPHASVSFTTK